MLTEMQKATMKVLADNDPELIQFLKAVGCFIMSPKIFSHLLKNGIRGKQLKEMIIRDRLTDPEKFVKTLNQQINSHLF